MKNIKDIILKNRRILIRVDFNLPIINGVIQSDFRLKAALPTIKYCLSENASIILMSHLGRPSGASDLTFSLRIIKSELELLLKTEILFSSDCISEESINRSLNLEPGQIHLLENLRFHKGEKENDYIFAENLAKHGEVFINDAFGTSHRKHASNSAIMDYFHESGYGLLCKKELSFISKKLNQPIRPYSVILGGAKVDGKIDLIENLLMRADNILIGGSMANPFLNVKGFSIGAAKVEKRSLGIAESLLNKAKCSKANIILPLDVVTVDSIYNKNFIQTKKVDKIELDEFGVDIGLETCKLYSKILIKSNTVFWNGPVGIAEISDYCNGTKALASTLKSITQNGATTIIGGGDTASIIIGLGLDKDFSHISTGGGASIHLLSGKKMYAFEG